MDYSFLTHLPDVFIVVQPIDLCSEKTSQVSLNNSTVSLIHNIAYYVLIAAHLIKFLYASISGELTESL